MDVQAVMSKIGGARPDGNYFVHRLYGDGDGRNRKWFGTGGLV